MMMKGLVVAQSQFTIMRLKVNKVFVLSMNDGLLHGKGTFEDPNIGYMFEMQNAMMKLNLYSKL
jgi:hypothetical protein